MKKGEDIYKIQWRKRNKKEVDNIGVFDLVIYDYYGELEEGVILDTYSDETERGQIRTDSNGNIDIDTIVYVIKDAGKQHIYDSSMYKESPSFREHFYEEYDLTIPENYNSTYQAYKSYQLWYKKNYNLPLKTKSRNKSL